MIKLINRAIILLIAISFTSANSAQLCNPNFELSIPSNSSNSSTSNKKEEVYLFLNGTVSMQGFTKMGSSENINYFSSVIGDLMQLAESIGNKVNYSRFGKSIKSINEREASSAIDEIFYACQDTLENCYSEESRIDKIFQTTELDENATYIIVTDLFIENKNLIGGKLHQLKKPLNKVLDDGHSIGIIGIMNSFNGTIYGIPISGGGVTTYSRANKRPFYIMIIGDQKNIHKVKTKLEKQYFTNNTDEYKFSLITSNPIIQNLSINKKINEKNLFRTKNPPPEFKFEYIKSNLPLYQFNTNQKRNLKFTIKKSEIIVPGSSGISNYEIKETLWSSSEVKCKKIN